MNNRDDDSLSENDLLFHVLMVNRYIRRYTHICISPSFVPGTVVISTENRY